MALNELARSGSGTVALAPEAGSERLRRLIKKGINEDDILKAMDAASQEDIKQMRLYFMVGLPTETDDDIQAIVDLSLKCKNVLERRRSAARISLSVAPFVPKAGTPFQWQPMEDLSTLERRISLLKKELRPAGVRVSGESPAWSEVQALLARGDVNLAEALASTQDVTLADWRQALKTHGIDAGRYTHEGWSPDRELPWAMIDHGSQLQYLRLG